MSVIHRFTHGAPALAWLAALLLMAAAPAQAQFTNRFNQTEPGDIVLIGNMVLHCPGTGTGTQIANCTAARNTTTPGGPDNGSTNGMVNVNVDGPMGATNSSSATLALPAGSTVLAARLYWAGAGSSDTSVTMRRPGVAGVSTVTGTSVGSTSGAYMSVADITAVVQAGGNGVYTVGNITATAGSGNWGGWSLVVAYRNPSEPVRNLTIYDGWTYGASGFQDIAISGFLTPASGPVDTRLGLVLFDGDRGVNDGGNSLEFGANTGSLSAVFNTLNPIQDVFNSTISDLNAVTTGRNPNYQNTLGMDIDRLMVNTPLPNNTTAAVLRIRATGSDVNWRGVVTLATTVHVPNLTASLTKTMTDVNGNTLMPGDEVLFTIASTNTGNDNSILNVLTDQIPANMTYVPGSLMVVSGANAGAKTDASGDDQAEYIAAPPARVVFRLGTGATGATGGTIVPTTGFNVTFRATVDAATPNGTGITNTASLAYRGATLSTDYTASANASDTINTTTGVTVGKTNSQTTYTPGVQSTYVITVGNTGPAVANGSVMRDTPPAGMTFGGITCTGATGGAVCPTGPGFNVTALGDGTGITLPMLPPGGTLTFSVTATVN